MKTPEEIEDLARDRFEEAKILYHNKKYDGSYYLAGYSIELALKAKICRRFGVPNLFDYDDKSPKEDGVKLVKNAVKTHDLFVLLILSGLKEKFDTDKASQKLLSSCSSIFFQGWSETLRYRPCGQVTEAECKKLIEILSRENGILQWIYNN